mmetsp:Transcript_17177/g.42661  ORF Transcript_17177/g.42661 Transcript_17177/m.42661 type:complete len:370 (+) Transcript_17177:365-1474(+)|eukprot:CAMPEP_0179010030 /NCGR_PEP_ID=MMETSP0795-20121207/16584_1 /TAXON_ID=88552 /ORGANISM="Amoebophrya sp., Strain Ameob2" /LENGTH=369 /DNA_ID=CAMNT_0020705259 /DNA_START=368 /DNA_END=1477 /DNA_ORIENTATION=+
MNVMRAGNHCHRLVAGVLLQLQTGSGASQQLFISTQQDKRSSSQQQQVENADVDLQLFQDHPLQELEVLAGNGDDERFFSTFLQENEGDHPLADNYNFDYDYPSSTLEREHERKHELAMLELKKKLEKGKPLKANRKAQLGVLDSAQAFVANGAANLENQAQNARKSALNLETQATTLEREVAPRMKKEANDQRKVADAATKAAEHLEAAGKRMQGHANNALGAGGGTAGGVGKYQGASSEEDQGRCAGGSCAGSEEDLEEGSSASSAENEGAQTPAVFTKKNAVRQKMMLTKAGRSVAASGSKLRKMAHRCLKLAETLDHEAQRLQNEAVSMRQKAKELRENADQADVAREVLRNAGGHIGGFKDKQT